MRFIPVKFDAVNCTIFKANSGNAFELAPSSRAECFPQTGNLTYPIASDNQFDLFNLTDNLEVFSHLLGVKRNRDEIASELKQAFGSLLQLLPLAFKLSAETAR